MRPRIQMLLGDTAGVGPELCVKVARDLPPEADGVQIVVTGDARVLADAERATATTIGAPTVRDFAVLDDHDQGVIVLDTRSEDAPSIPRGTVSAAAGREVLAALMDAIRRAQDGRIDGIVFAPFNKESMHLAGSEHYSELELFKQEFDRDDIPGEFNLIDRLWIARVTSHIPLGNVTATLSVDRIARTIELLGAAQEQAGIVPRLAIAALNPHAGEHGMFGDEEARLIEPAMKHVAQAHPSWTLVGPMPADTLFPRIRKEDSFSGVVGMYHDQLQIATKLIGLERGVTVHPGMAVPIATAAHGTAFDLVGTGRAGHAALRNALAVVCDMATSRART